MTLRPAHRLVLEGAEDIDVLGPSGAETVQVKAVEANLTLRSEDVLEAIFNYWSHRLRNPNVSIDFRLLTTAERGQETGDPFGGVRGLDHWDRCRRPGTSLQPLRDFLLAREFKIGGRTDEAKEANALILDDLLTFLRSAPEEDVRDALIRRIHWDTGQGATEEVRERVNRVVEDYGLRQHGLGPSESRKVVPLLLDHAWNVATSKENRILEYIDFARIFEEHLTIRVPFATAQSMGALATGGLLAGVLGGRGATHSRFEALPLFRSPAAVDNKNFLERSTLVGTVVQSLQDHGIAAVAGSTGMGKSTLARLVTEAYDAEWSVLDLRGENPAGIRTKIEQALLLLPSKAEGKGYLIDDLNFDEDVARYETTLLAFLREAQERGDIVLITTQGEVPSRITAELQIPVPAALTIPPLDRAEIRALAIKHGCPEHRADAWSLSIFASTSGHPQLAHAAIRNRQAVGWDEDPPPVLRDQGLAEVQREARQRLRDQLTDPDSRRLAYRLSIFAHPFRRSHALELADGVAPGEAFDRLLGPWVERMDAERFRVSPLLAESAAETYGPGQLRELHQAAARAIMADRRISSPELAGLFTHGLAGGTEEALFAGFLAYQQIPFEHRERVAPYLFPLALTHVQDGKSLYPNNVLISILLRSIQFEIAAILSPDDLAPHAAFAWEAEIQNAQTQVPADMVVGLRWTFVMGTLIRTEARLPFGWIIDRTLEVIRNGGLPSVMGDVDLPPLPSEFGGIEATLLQALRHRCRNSADALDVLREFSHRAEQDVYPLLEAVERDHETAEGFVQRMAIGAFGEEPSDAVADEGTALAIALGEKLNLPAFVAAGYRARAARASEVKRDDARAMATLSEGAQAIGSDHPLLEDWRARAHITAGRLHEAAETWKDLLPRWDTGSLILRAYSARDAVMAAGRSGDWEGALWLAEHAQTLMEQVHDLGMAAGLKAEQAHALWKLGRYQEAVEGYAQALERAEALDDPEQDLRSHVLQKTLGHALLWSLHNATERDSAEIVEPPAGGFSAPEPNEEFRNLPLQPIGTTWQLLSTVADAVGAEPIVKTRAAERASRASVLPTELLAGDLQIKRLLRDGPLDDLVHAWAGLQATVHRLSAHVESGRGIFEAESEDSDESKLHADDVVAALHVLSLGLIRAAGAGERNQVPLDGWKHDLEKLGLGGDLVEHWFRLASAFENGTSLPEAVQVLENAAYEAPLRTVAAILLAVHSNQPEHCLPAHVLLLLAARQRWGTEIGPFLEALVVPRWQTICQEMRYALLTPRFTVPAIQDACTDTQSSGLRKVARVLLAARGAVQILIQDGLLEQVRATAE